MKQVHSSHHNTANAFADPSRDPNSTGRTTGGNRVFFDGPNAFSYGRHFCAAQLFPEVNAALVTTRKYSQSTSGHVAALANALKSAGWDVHRTEL